MEMQQVLRDEGIIYDDVGTSKDVMKFEAHNFRVDLSARDRDMIDGVGKWKAEGQSKPLKKKKKGR